MYDVRALQFIKYCVSRAAVFVCLLGLVQVTQAAKLPDFSKAGVTTTGNTAKIGIPQTGSTWGSTIPISPTIGGWSQAGNYGIPSAAKGTTMNMSASGDVFFSGTKYPFQAGYTVPASAVWSGLASAAGVVGGIAGGPVGLGLIVAGTAAPYIKQWMDDAGVRPNSTGTGLEKSDPLVCSVAPCYEYYSASYTTPAYPNVLGACQRHILGIQTGYPNNGYIYVSHNDTTRQCVYGSTKGGISGGTVTMFFRSIAARTATWLPSSMDDIAPYMQQKPFDPRVIPEILSKGGDIPMPSPTVTGPTSLPGPTTVTKNPDGSTTTIYNTSTFSTTGDTITNITNIQTTIITNSSSTIISTSTSTVTPAPADKEDPKNPCDQNPDAAGCQKLDVPAGEIPKSTREITYAPESHFGGGSCPTDKFVTLYTGQTLKVWDWAGACDKINAWFRPLLLTLAALGALFIVAPGFKGD